MIMFVIKK